MQPSPHLTGMRRRFRVFAAVPPFMTSGNLLGHRSIQFSKARGLPRMMRIAPLLRPWLSRPVSGHLNCNLKIEDQFLSAEHLRRAMQCPSVEAKVDPSPDWNVRRYSIYLQPQLLIVFQSQGASVYARIYRHDDVAGGRLSSRNFHRRAAAQTLATSVPGAHVTGESGI